MGKNKASYIRPKSVKTLIHDENIVGNNRNQRSTATNCQKKPFKDCFPSQQTLHRREIEKRINNSSDIISLILYLSSINLCFGKF